MENEQIDPSYLEVDKTGLQLFQNRKTVSQLFGERKMWIPAIWRQQNVFHNSLEQGKSEGLLFLDRKTSSQLFGARKSRFQLFGS